MVELKQIDYRLTLELDVYLTLNRGNGSPCREFLFQAPRHVDTTRDASVSTVLFRSNPSQLELDATIIRSIDNNSILYTVSLYTFYAFCATHNSHAF